MGIKKNIRFMPLCRNAVFTGISAQQRHECAFYFVPILGLDR